jgi:hypothetical protein
VLQDSGLPNTKGAGLVVPTQADRALGYKNYTTTLAKLPYVIGFHWFEWFDEPAEGRKLDGENSNYGLVTINGAPFPSILCERFAQYCSRVRCRAMRVVSCRVVLCVSCFQMTRTLC